MPEPYKRSRNYRRIRTRLPGGENVIHYKHRAPGHSKCAKCGAVLMGTPRERPYKMKKLGITSKRPDRRYGGYLCTKCSREAIKQEARAS